MAGAVSRGGGGWASSPCNGTPGLRCCRRGLHRGVLCGTPIVCYGATLRALMCVVSEGDGGGPDRRCVATDAPPTCGGARWMRVNVYADAAFLCRSGGTGGGQGCTGLGLQMPRCCDRLRGPQFHRAECWRHSPGRTGWGSAAPPVRVWSPSPPSPYTRASIRPALCQSP